MFLDHLDHPCFTIIVSTNNTQIRNCSIIPREYIVTTLATTIDQSIDIPDTLPNTPPLFSTPSTTPSTHTTSKKSLYFEKLDPSTTNSDIQPTI